MKKLKKKWVILGIVLIVIIVAGIAVKTLVFSKDEAASTTIPMQTTTLSKGTLVESISESGTIESNNVENVCSSVTAPINAINVEVGDTVKAGQVLATLDMEDVYNDCAKAKATLNSAQRALDAKQAEYDKNKALYEYEGVTKEALKTSETDLANAKDTYENALVNYNTLSEDLDEGSITSPIDGTITESSAKIGLKPPEDDTLFVVEDVNDLYVTAKVSEHNIGSIKVGQDVQVTTNVTGNTAYKGKVSYISPKAVSKDTTDVEFEIRVKILDPGTMIKIGMNAYLQIIVNQKDNVYSVPFDAVGTAQGGAFYIYAVENNTIVQIPVETGLENATNIEISGDGLKDGLLVVTNPTIARVTVGQTVDLSSNKNGAGVGNTSSGTPASGTAPSRKSTSGTTSGQSAAQGTATQQPSGKGTGN